MNARLPVTSSDASEVLMDPVMIPNSPWHATLFGVCATRSREIVSEAKRPLRPVKPLLADAKERSKYRKDLRRQIEDRMVEVVQEAEGISSGRIVDKLLAEYPEFAQARMHNFLTRLCEDGQRIERRGARGSYKHYLPESAKTAQACSQS